VKVGKDGLRGVKVISDEEREMTGNGELMSNDVIKIQGKSRMKQTSIPPPKGLQKRILINDVGRKSWMTGERVPIPRFMKMAIQHGSIKMRIGGERRIIYGDSRGNEEMVRGKGEMHHCVTDVPLEMGMTENRIERHIGASRDNLPSPGEKGTRQNHRKRSAF
jgi:hypothetical protein